MGMQACNLQNLLENYLRDVVLYGCWTCRPLVLADVLADFFYQLSCSFVAEVDGRVVGQDVVSDIHAPRSPLKPARADDVDRPSVCMYILGTMMPETVKL